MQHIFLFFNVALKKDPVRETDTEWFPCRGIYIYIYTPRKTFVGPRRNNNSPQSAEVSLLFTATDLQFKERERERAAEALTNSITRSLGINKEFPLSTITAACIMFSGKVYCYRRPCIVSTGFKSIVG